MGQWKHQDRRFFEWLKCPVVFVGVVVGLVVGVVVSEVVGAVVWVGVVVGVVFVPQETSKRDNTIRQDKSNQKSLLFIFSSLIVELFFHYISIVDNCQ
jgi:hypothetical protein